MFIKVLTVKWCFEIDGGNIGEIGLNEEEESLEQILNQSAHFTFYTHRLNSSSSFIFREKKIKINSIYLAISNYFEDLQVFDTKAFLFVSSSSNLSKFGSSWKEFTVLAL
jgi:hypothetical protein